MKTMFRLSAALAPVIGLNVAAPAASYNFVKIAETDEHFSAFALTGVWGSGLPTINDAGRVAFWASTPGGSGIYTGEWNSLSGVTVASVASTGAYYSGFGRGLPAINNAGDVAISASLTAGGAALHRISSSLFITTIAGGPTGVGDFSAWSDWPAMSPYSGQVGFHGSQADPVYYWLFVPGIWRSTGGEPTTIATGSSSIYSGHGVSINAYNQVAWIGTHTGGSGVHVGGGGSVATWANTAGIFSGFHAVCSINSPATCVACGPPAVKVAFAANLDAGGSGVFTAEWPSSSVTPIVTAIATGPVINSFEVPSINSQGKVVFRREYLSDGGKALFTGSDLVVDRVVGTGDVLDRRTVTDVRSSKQAINEAARIAFRAQFSDGSAGIFIGVPCRADVTGDHTVNVNDLLAVISAWGAGSGAADVTRDGAVNVNDLLEVISAWGPCPIS